MRIVTKEANGIVFAELSGELDHHSINAVRTALDIELKIKSPTALVLDFEDVSFMDSSGIGFVMGRYKVMQEIGGKVIIQNPPNDIERVMRLSGLNRLVVIRFTDRSVNNKQH